MGTFWICFPVCTQRVIGILMMAQIQCAALDNMDASAVLISVGLLPEFDYLQGTSLASFSDLNFSLWKSFPYKGMFISICFFKCHG